MKRDLGGALRWLALPTAALLVVAGLAPGRIELALRIYALLLAAAVVAVALLALRRSFPPESTLNVDPPARRRPVQPASLARLQNEVLLGIASSFDLHYRLVPRLRWIAEGLLASRRRLSLSADGERARDALGEEAWRLVRPDRPAPDDRLAEGIRPPELARVVAALEDV